jgi:hypothetical protein
MQLVIQKMFPSFNLEPAATARSWQSIDWLVLPRARLLGLGLNSH